MLAGGLSGGEAVLENQGQSSIIISADMVKNFRKDNLTSRFQLLLFFEGF